MYLDNTFDPDHQGIGGHTTADVLEDLPEVLSDLGEVDIVLLGIGGNDALEGGSGSVTDAISNVNSIIDLLQANNPNVIIFLEQIAPGMSSIMTADLTAAINNFNNQISLVAANQSNSNSTVIAVDMATGWQDSYLADDVHYNAIGAEVVASRYSEAFKSLYDCNMGGGPTTAADLEVQQESLILYPNPTSGFFTIKGSFTNYAIEILSSDGMVYQDLSDQSSPIEIDLSALPAGLYFVRVVNNLNQNVSLQQIIKTE